VRIGKPTADRDGVLGVEDVRSRRVVNDNGILEVSPNLGQILDVVALVVVATLSEEPVVYNLVDIKLVK
jgi:hypothetical protein